MHNFRELRVWQRSMDLAEAIYKLTAGFPREEKYGLSSQLQRSAVSIPSNISEGAGRGTNKQFRQFLEISMGSCNEVLTQLELCSRFKYIEKETFDIVAGEANQICKMIFVFYKSLGEQ